MRLLDRAWRVAIAALLAVGVGGLFAWSPAVAATAPPEYWDGTASHLWSPTNVTDFPADFGVVDVEVNASGVAYLLRAPYSPADPKSPGNPLASEVWTVTTDGVMTKVATAIQSEDPVALALSPSGDIFVITGGHFENRSSLIRIRPDGSQKVLTTFGSPERAKLMDVDPAGNVYIVTQNGSVRKVAVDGQVTDLITLTYLDRQAKSTMKVDSTGAVYYSVGSGSNLGTLRKVSPDGTLTVLSDDAMVVDFPAPDPADVYVVSAEGLTRIGADGRSTLVMPVSVMGQGKQVWGLGDVVPLGYDRAGNLLLSLTGYWIDSVSPSGTLTGLGRIDTADPRDMTSIVFMTPNGSVYRVFSTGWQGPSIGLARLDPPPTPPVSNVNASASAAANANAAAAAQAAALADATSTATAAATANAAAAAQAAAVANASTKASSDATTKGSASAAANAASLADATATTNAEASVAGTANADNASSAAAVATASTTASSTATADVGVPIQTLPATGSARPVPFAAMGALVLAGLLMLSRLFRTNKTSPLEKKEEHL